MHVMFECAARWELFNDRRNPIQIVRIKGSTKRRQRPTVLTVPEYETILSLLRGPCRTMVLVAQCLGLRVSEIAALQWDDFDFEKNQLLVQRSFVNGRVDDVKTEYSRDYVPLHESLVEVLLAWSKEALPTEEGWVFASPWTNKPYHPTEMQKRQIRPAGCCLVECPKCGAGYRRVVQARSTDAEWQAATGSQRAHGGRREVRLDRLAYVPPHLPFVAGRDRSADEGAAGTDAARFDSDDHERLRTGNAGVEAGGEWQGRGDGAQTDESERLKP